jgi:transposase-like protein
VSKKRVRRYDEAFRKMALERMKTCGSVKTLAEELGIHRTVLYQWREQREAGGNESGSATGLMEQALRVEVAQWKQLLGEKTREVDFFKGALQKVKARRQSSGSSGEKASTTESGS